MLARFAVDMLFRNLEQIQSGTLCVTTPDGITRSFIGKIPDEDANASIEIHDWSVIKNMMQRGDIGFAEDYRDGKWDTNNLTSLTLIGLNNRAALNRFICGNGFSRALSRLSYLFRMNSLKGSRKNIHAHYDLGNEFYQLWLDPSMTYSSAIFSHMQETLEQAQTNKYKRILSCLPKLSGSLLEIGCGWGGFAEHAQNNGDFAIKGITLSEEQCSYARKRLGGYADIVLEDYRHQQGTFDHIISIEMFEAVGQKYWQTYFEKIRSLLSKNGKAIIQVITINDHEFPRYRRSGDFIRSFIFPGGMLPSPSRFHSEATKSGFNCNNTYYFGADYAKTLEYWLDNFDRQHNRVQALGFDDGFIRLWRFYLAACIAGFKAGRTDVMQVELSHASI